MSELPDGIDVSALDDACYEYHREYVTDWDADHLAPRVAAIREALGLGAAELRATPAAVTPEPAGPLREWADPEGGRIYEVQPGWAVWGQSRQIAEREHAYRNRDGALTYGAKVEDLAYHGATEVPAVPPAEPGAGA